MHLKRTAFVCNLWYEGMHLKAAALFNNAAPLSMRVRTERNASGH